MSGAWGRLEVVRALTQAHHALETPSPSSPGGSGEEIMGENGCWESPAPG